jgi:hypothetical protein
MLFFIREYQCPYQYFSTFGEDFPPGIIDKKRALSDGMLVPIPDAPKRVSLVENKGWKQSFTPFAPKLSPAAYRKRNVRSPNLKTESSSIGPLTNPSRL